MTYREYFQMLEDHDWYYTFSDDASAYKAGKENLELLERIAHDSKSNIPVQMFEAWNDYVSAVIQDKEPANRPTIEDFRIR